MKILSVVIPSYNSEQYLDKCINSLAVDDVIDKLDIIIVNDGSTDNTAVIADKYADVYPNSVRVIHQENKGHGGAVNSGCNGALGKYLKVLDADDTFVSENIKEYVSALESIDSDVVLTHYYTTDIDSGEIKMWMSYPKEFGKSITLARLVSDWNDYSRCIALHGITYKTEFYKSVGYSLTEKVFYEDQEFSAFPACFAKDIVALDIFVYNYRVGDINQSVSDKSKISRMGDMVSVLHRFAKEYNALQGDDSVREFVCQRVKVLLLSYLTTSLLVDKNKRAGRNNAKIMMEFIENEIPRAYELSLKQYKVFLMLNRLGINKKAFDKVLQSKIYRRLKGTKDFN